MYHLAWVVVEVENTDSWNWFLKLLAEDVGIENNSGGGHLYQTDRR